MTDDTKKGIVVCLIGLTVVVLVILSGIAFRNHNRSKKLLHKSLTRSMTLKSFMEYIRLDLMNVQGVTDPQAQQSSKALASSNPECVNGFETLFFPIKGTFC